MVTVAAYTMLGVGLVAWLLGVLSEKFPYLFYKPSVAESEHELDQRAEVKRLPPISSGTPAS
jgi:hypothetical protein